MHVVADNYIPFLKGILEPYAEVRYLEPEEITAEAVRHADALLIRTRTRCNAALLEGSSVRFIATATIGYDHIDTAYCESHGIFWTNSPGCNAQGVCDYVEEALEYLKSSNSPSPDGRSNLQIVRHPTDAQIGRSPLKSSNPVVPTIGIVGVGHVGSLVAKMAKSRGYRVLLNDPPKEDMLRERGDLSSFVSLDEIARESDIITFHTPLTRDGDYPTWHICDRAFLEKCKPGAVIINAARGGIIDEAAILSLHSQLSTLNSPLSTLNSQLSTSLNSQLSTLNSQLSTSLNSQLSTLNFIIDTWEGEPRISRQMLQRAQIATYHIAGYTLQGKINATNLCLEALCRHFSLPKLQIPAEALPPQPPTKPGWITKVDRQLRQHPEQFETLRETYPLR